MKINPAQGFTLLSSVFILIVLGMAGQYMMKIALTEVQIVNLSFLSTQATLIIDSHFEMVEQAWREKKSCQNSTLVYGEKVQGFRGYTVSVTCLQNYHYPDQNPNFFASQVNIKASYNVLGARDHVRLEKTKWLALDEEPTP